MANPIIVCYILLFFHFRGKRGKKRKRRKRREVANFIFRYFKDILSSRREGEEKEMKCKANFVLNLYNLGIMYSLTLLSPKEKKKERRKTRRGGRESEWVIMVNDIMMPGLKYYLHKLYHRKEGERKKEDERRGDKPSRSYRCAGIL